MDASKDSVFGALLEVVRNLREKIENFEDLTAISADHGKVLPIVGTEHLYVRKSYKDLYQSITSTFKDHIISERQNRIVVTGTSGIGKSAFLVYFIVRLLFESDADKPPIIIFHEKQGSECYLFGGTSILCQGVIKDFRDLLFLPQTWYLADSSTKPELKSAKTVISASPKTLFEKYKEVMKAVVWTYYLAPWNLDELEVCRSICFENISEKLMRKLFAK
ncbi:hypothetical protein BGX27_006164, partial [Mortierella sp. AM989]